MSDFKSSVDIEAGRDQVFNFVSDVRNMPRYLPTVESAEILEEDRVRMTGVASGRRYDTISRIHLDPDERMMRWNADSDRNYKGELLVTGDEHRSTLSLCLFFAPQSHEKHLPDEEIRQSLMQSLETIKALCEELPAPRQDHSAYLG